MQLKDAKTSEAKIHQQAKVEMWIKKHEDPLYQIVGEEQKARRKILENPLKLKEINERLRKSQSTLERKQNSGPNSSEEATLGKGGDDCNAKNESNDILAQYLALMEKKNAAKKLNSASKTVYRNDVSSSKSKKMTQQEKSAKLAEMQRSAVQRKEDRETTVAKYKNQMEREEVALRKQSEITK